MPDFTPASSRPMVQSSSYSVTSGHYLASLAGARILERGGNAVDAGVATGICINVVQPDMTNFGGVAPIILYLAKTREVVTISGVGCWPKRASLGFFRDQRGGRIPYDITNAVVPAACDAWLTALARYGRLTLAEVLAPALELADEGFPVNHFLAHNLEVVHDRLRSWPTSALYLRPDGSPLQPGDALRQPDLASTFRTLIAAERGVSHLGREAAIMAARDVFYKGDLAEQMAAFSREEGGFLDLADLAEFSVQVEPAVHASYRGYDVYACGPWCQGPIVLQTLNILEGVDLAALDHNSAGYIHLVTEALKASFTDRHAYFGDPDFVRVPINGLLHKEYAQRWLDRISRTRATPAMPEAGDPWPYESVNGPVGAAPPAALAGPRGGDTSNCCVVDQEGNGFSATTSDGVDTAPLVPGVGVILSSRGRQSWLDPEHPSSLQPGKRPRLTPAPGLMLKDRKLAMVYGSPGGDVQPQAMLQLVLNLVDFGMDPQSAVEAPRFSTYSFPDSFNPHPYNPGLLRVEGRVPAETLAELQRLGHTVERWPAFTSTAGALTAILVDSPWGARTGAADPRRMSYAIGW